MGGGVMERAIDVTAEIDGLVEQLGRLPDAPLAMPKQRLGSGTPVLGFIGRLIGRGSVPMGTAGHSGR
jgi:hypothetical protein